MTVHVTTGRRSGSADAPSRHRLVVLDHATIVAAGAPAWTDALTTDLTRRLQPATAPAATAPAAGGFVDLADAVRDAVAVADEHGDAGTFPAPGVLVCRWTADLIEVLVSGAGTAIVDGRPDRPGPPIQRIAGGRWPVVARIRPPADATAVLLMTESVAAVVDRYAAGGFPHWFDILELVSADGVQALVDHVHGVEATDPHRHRRPRPAVHDDKTAVLVTTGSYRLRNRLAPPYDVLAAGLRAVERGDADRAADLFHTAAGTAADLIAAGDEEAHSALHTALLGRADALARAGRLDELAALADTDRHARRRLDQRLFDDGRADALRERAAGGDRTALYLLITLLRSRGADDEARAAAALAPGDDHAHRLLHEPPAMTAHRTTGGRPA